MRRLIGVGVGPGDPELITVKAIPVLRAADQVFVPVLARPGEEDCAEEGRAEATVRAHADAARIRRIAFALNEPGAVTPGRAAAWDAAARGVAAAFAVGARTVAFATIGDPAIYSTFSYLAQTVTGLAADVTIETVPGTTPAAERRPPSARQGDGNRWAGRANLLDDFLVPRPVQHHYHHILHAFVYGPGDDGQRLGDRRVDVERIAALLHVLNHARAVSQLRHVK